MDFILMRPVFEVGVLGQISIVTILFCIIVATQYKVFQKTGKLSAGYPVNAMLFFAPIYEEIIFRGFLLAGLLPLFGIIEAIIISSVLFGLWHIRSVFFMNWKLVLVQVLYAGIILGPIFGFITLKTGTIWVAVILHYFNNILSPVLSKYYR